MNLPTLDEALKEASKYKAQNSSNLPGLDMALKIASLSLNDAVMQERLKAFKGIKPPEDLRAMPDLAVQPEAPKYSLMDSVREAGANFIRGFAPSNMDTEYYKYLASLSDEDFDKAIDAGQVNWRDIALKYLPQEERAKLLQSQVDSAADWGKSVEDAAKYISPAPAAPTKPLDKAADAIIKAMPELMGNAALYAAGGLPGAILGNAFYSNQSAREQAFKNLREQGTAFPEAYGRANSTLWNAADIGINAGSNALAFGLMGKKLNIGDTFSPITQRALNILGGAGIGGFGSGVGSALRDVWGGQDINADNALSAGVKNAVITGLAGLFNSALEWRGIRDAQNLDRLVKEHAARHNAAITKYGFTPVSKNYTFEDSALQIQNALYNGTLSRADARAMLVEAGYPDDVVVSILQKAAFEPRLHGTGGEANFTMPVDPAPNPDIPQIPFTPRAALNPGKPIEEIRRAANIAKYTSGANQWQNNLVKQIYDAIKGYQERQALTEPVRQQIEAQNEILAQQREYEDVKREQALRQEAQERETARLEQERAAVEALQSIQRERNVMRNNQQFNAQNEINAQAREYEQSKQEQQVRQEAQNREIERLENERRNLSELAKLMNVVNNAATVNQQAPQQAPQQANNNVTLADTLSPIVANLTNIPARLTDKNYNPRDAESWPDEERRSEYQEARTWAKAKETGRNLSEMNNSLTARGNPKAGSLKEMGDKVTRGYNKENPVKYAAAKANKLERQEIADYGQDVKDTIEAVSEGIKTLGASGEDLLPALKNVKSLLKKQDAAGHFINTGLERLETLRQTVLNRLSGQSELMAGAGGQPDNNIEAEALEYTRAGQEQREQDGAGVYDSNKLIIDEFTDDDYRSITGDNTEREGKAAASPRTSETLPTPSEPVSAMPRDDKTQAGDIVHEVLEAAKSEQDKKLALPDGYTIEGSKDSSTLKGAKQGQFILRDGKRDWGYITDELAAGRDNVPTGGIRVQARHKGWGLRHVKSKHTKDALENYSSVEEFIAHVIDDCDEIIPLAPDKNGRVTEFLVAKNKNEKKRDAVVIAWDKDNGYYLLKSAYSPNTQHVEKQRTLSSENSAPTSSPASTSIAYAADSTPPGNNDATRYEDSDSNNISQGGQSVKADKDTSEVIEASLEYKSVEEGYKLLKEKRPNEMLLFKQNYTEVYRMLFDDAETGAEELDIALIQRGKYKLLDIPYHALKIYADRLVRNGHRLVVCEQTKYGVLVTPYSHYSQTANAERKAQKLKNKSIKKAESEPETPSKAESEPEILRVQKGGNYVRYKHKGKYVEIMTPLPSSKTHGDYTVNGRPYFKVYIDNKSNAIYYPDDGTVEFLDTQAVPADEQEEFTRAARTAAKYLIAGGYKYNNGYVTYQYDYNYSNSQGREKLIIGGITHRSEIYLNGELIGYYYHKQKKITLMNAAKDWSEAQQEAFKDTFKKNCAQEIDAKAQAIQEFREKEREQEAIEAVRQPEQKPEAQSVKTQEQEVPSKPESKPEPNQEQDVKAAAIAEIKKEQTKTAEQPAGAFDYNGSKIEYSVSSDGTNRYIVLSDGERIGIYNPASNRFTYQGAANDWTKQEKAKFSKQFKEHYNNFLQTAAPKPEEDSKDAIDSEAAAQDTDQTIEAQASEIADKETSEQPMDADKAAAKKSASIRLADWVKRRLTIGTFAPITNSQLIEMAEKEFGGSLAKGTFNMKDVYDAMEMGVNKAIQALKINPRLAANPSVVLTHLNKLNEIMGCLPTQQTNTRTAEQNEFQQFSTPPHIAYVANWLANISKNDTVLEPSAGVGGLAVFAKNAGATVVMNELSDRRAGLLDEMNLGHVFRVNAEHINDMLPDDVKPTRIVMNPPFSSTAGRISGQRKTSNAYAHVEQALLRLEDGGRLVAILGKGMNDDAPAHREWWNRIKSKYNVRANVILDGTEYSKYGTSFGNVIVVIDKSGPTPENGTVTGNYKKLPDMIVSLLDVRNSVPDTAVKQRTQDKTKSEAAEPSEPEVKSESAAKPKAKAVKSEAVKTEQKPEIQPEQDIKEPEAQPEKPVAEIKTENKTEAEQQEERKANKNDDVNYVYDNYRPSKLKIAGAKHHPADLVESAAMGSITMPDITYKPHLDSKIITQGLLSDAQLEAVVYAGQAFTVMNNDGTRRGFFIGDGTGLGKGREIAGVITDQMNQGHGKGKAVWISMKHNLISDAKRDYAGIGNNPDDIFSQQNIKGDIENSKGILFTAYSMIRNEKRLEQLKKWLDEDFDGVIALDEVHNANNAVDSQGGRGRTKASQQGLAVGDLVKAFPKARILYVSATGATEVKNLAMLDRLGLWGAGTQFANKQDFINEIEAGGKSAMEVVARDLKAMGLYVARSISKRAGPYGGSENVTFSRLTHSLTGEQTAIYNKIAEGWQIVLKNIDEALKLCGANEKNKPHAASAALSKFYSLQQKCFNQIITALQTPAVIEDIKKQLANGNSVIIQLTNTDEAALKAAIAGLKEDETLEDLDITPKDALINFLKTSFPVTLLEEYEDENHNIRMRQVLDRDGNPVISKEAVKLRDRLIDDINSIRFPQSPLDMIINEFGTKQVAEITGRTQRVVRDETGKLVREKLSPKAREADKTAFNEGRKRILIFSEAGGTGASYHASLDFKNQQKRIHYLLQAGWKADTAVQGLGRGDRSNQAHRAHYVLVETDVPGQKRFISTIARRLEQLGALTTGERKTATQGLFSESDNLESIYAKDALDKLFVALKYGRYNDINSYEVMRDMGYKSYFDKDKKDNAPPITQFLNRILALDIDTQKKLFKHFEDLIEANVAMAIERGTFDAGTETIRADKINIKQEHTVYKDKTNGIETKYIKLEVMNKQKPVSMAVAKVQGFTSFYKNREGNVVAAKLTKGNGTDLSTGAIKPKYLLKSPDPSYRATTTRLDNPEYYMPLSEEEASQLWGEQSLAVPEFKVTEKHMITGALMPIWKSLDGSPQIQRVMTDDGRTFLGRIIPQTLLKNTLVKLGAKDQLAKVTPQELLKRLEKQGASANLSNGWVLKTVRVNGGKRIEILYANFYYKNQLEQQGAIVEEQYNSGRRVFIPEGNETLLQQILDAYEVIGFNDDIALEGEETINANIPDSALDTNLYFIHPEIRKWMEIFNMTARPAYGADNPAAPFIETSANKSNYEFEDKAMEDLYQADKNIRPQSAMGKIAHFVNQVIKPFTSDYPELEGDDAFIPVKEDLRKLKREMLASSQEIVNKLRYIVEDMKPDDYDLFNRVVVLRDYQETKQLNPEAQLPEGYTIESVDKELDRMNEKVQKNKLVSRAIARAEEIEREIVRELIEAAKELDWDIEDKFKRQHYFRHTVIEYIDAAKSGASQGLKAPDNRGYMRQRKGSDKAIITDYIRAMGEVWSRMQGDIKITKVLAKIRDKFDIADELKREAFIKNEQKTMVHLAEQLGNMDEAQKYVKRELNKTQAAALTRLFNLARDNKLPTGGNKEFASVAELMAKTGQIELLSDKDRKRFNKYLSWLAGLEETDSGRQAARWYFSGVKKKQKAVKNMLGKEYLTFQDLIPDNYDAYDPFSNRLVFSVNTVPEYLMKLAEDSIDQMLHIPLHDITRALVMGGHRQLWVIPKALADTLNNIAKSMPQGMLSTYANEATGWWKNYVLTTPFRGRIWKYNLRNFLGDAESILQANPGAVKYFWQALKELFDVFYYNKQATGLLAEFQKRGGGLTTESVQELRTWENMKEFEHLINKQGHINPFTLPITAVKQYWTLASKITNFRETWLRYADFISRVNQIQENYERHGTMRPTSYGFSKKAEVLAHDNIYDMAFKLSNEDLGAYDQVSEAMQHLRKFWLPFGSFQELVIRRNIQGLKNIWQGGSWGEYWLTRKAEDFMKKFNEVYGDGSVPPKIPNNNQTGGASDSGDDQHDFNLLFKSLGRHAKYPVFVLRAILTMAMLSPFMLGFHIINRIFMRKFDDDLTPDERAQPHITLGRNPWTGNVIYFNRIGSGFDFLDILGLDTIFKDVKDIRDGHMTFWDLFKQITAAPLNKAINTLTPFIKTPVEATVGRSLYPDFRHPRIIKDMGAYLASTVNLDWWYKAITGKPHEPFFDVVGSVAYQQNPIEASYYYILASKRQFQENVLGKKFDGYATTRRGEALNNFRAALKYNDKNKAIKYLTEYVELGGTQEGLESSTNAMHPLAGLNKLERAQFIKWLRPDEHKVLGKALDYYIELARSLGVKPKL